MVRRKIRDREDARACLEAAAASGIPRAAWAHANGVDARSLNAWRISMERTVRKPELRLVELVALDQAPGRSFRVSCGSLSVEVEDGFDADALRRLLRVVASC